jgi:hypothetical protein
MIVMLWQEKVKKIENDIEEDRFNVDFVWSCICRFAVAKPEFATRVSQTSRIFLSFVWFDSAL